MATLDNFHTGNNPRPLYPNLQARHACIREGVHSNRSWDPASEGPVAPVASYNPALRSSGHPSPQIEERLSTRGLTDHFVPTLPRTRRRNNDTVSGVQLFQDSVVQPAARWMNLLTGRTRATLPLVSRFHPYLR